MAEETDPPANFVRAWRVHRGLTQEQLGEMIGTTGAVISLLESGDRPLSDKWLRKLATALQTTAGTLLDRGPGEEAEILNMWDHADLGQRRQLVRVAEVLMRYRSD